MSVSSRPNCSSTALNTAAISASFVTSHGRISDVFSKVPASSSTLSFRRSPWYVNARRIPSRASACAIAHAMERLLATPRTSPVFPSSIGMDGSYVLRHFGIHPAGHHEEEHPVVGGERVEGVAERRRLVVLDEEVAVPRE